MKKVDVFVNRFEEIMVAFTLFTGGAMLFMNVILRYFFESGIVWAEEYTRFAIIWLTFIGSSIAVRESAHLGVTAIVDSVKSPTFKKITHYTVVSISLLFTLFLVYYGGTLSQKIFNHGTRSSAMEIPMIFAYIAIPLGGLLMAYRYAQQLFLYDRGGVR